jgi:hypothetical protein
LFANQDLVTDVPATENFHLSLTNPKKLVTPRVMQCPTRGAIFLLSTGVQTNFMSQWQKR